jgi:type I restriction enzyme S subunit
MKKYDSYKDSGVDWIGYIPIGWEFYNLKFILREGVKDGPHETPVWFEDGIPFLSIDGIVDGEISFANCRFIDEEQYQKFSKKLIIEKDDIFIGKAASIGKIARVKTDRKFTVWSPIAVIKVKKEFSPTFVEYYFKSDIIQHQIEFFSTSNTQKNIAMGDIPKMKFIAPSFEEQTQIANYLDHKTAKIDELISKKEKLIELLQEERTAIINQAVTKGLNPNAPMKDSGIEWLGEIPAHWEVKKLKYVCNLISNKTSDKPEYILALENIESWSGKIIGDPYSNQMEGDVQLFQKDDILFNKLRPYLAKVTLVQNNGGAMGELLVLRPNQLVTSNFLYQRLRSEMIITVVDGSTYGTKMPRASWDKFISHLEFGIPSIKEQLLISNYIDLNEKRIDLLIEKTKQEIELLKEYKTALISEVVTGKVDIRDEVIK